MVCADDNPRANGVTQSGREQVHRAIQQWPLRTLHGGPGRWWFTGGAALLAHFGARYWRPLGDVDVTINASNDVLFQLRRLLPYEPLWANDFRRWIQTDSTTHHETRTFGAPNPAGPGPSFRRACLEQDQWHSPNRPDVAMPADQAVLTSADGTPYLAPELVLLGKSRQARPKDHDDFTAAALLLEQARMKHLLALLEPDHPWGTQAQHRADS